MVLEVADTSSSSDFASTTDFSSAENGIAYHIDTAAFPKPFILGRFFNYTDANMAKRIHKRLQASANFMKRPLSEDEVTAFAYWTCREYRLESYGAPLGLAAGWYRANATKASWKYPLIKAKPDFNPEVFRILGIKLTGEMAKRTHMSTRNAIYGVMGGLLGFWFMAGVGSAVAVAGQLKDSRLKTITGELEQKAKEERAAHMRQRHEGGNTGIQNRPPLSGPGRGWNQAPSRQGEMDDASPTGTEGMEEYTYATYPDSSSLDSSQQDQSTLQQAAHSSSSVTSRTSSWNPPKTGPSSDTSSSSSFYGDDTDDASPTAPAQPHSGVSGRGGGSTWDRIRQSSNAQGSRPHETRERGKPQPRGLDSSYSANDYTFSSSDEERQLAREQAQKDFDAQIERERQGTDFGVGDKGRRW